MGCSSSRPQVKESTAVQYKCATQINLFKVDQNDDGANSKQGQVDTTKTPPLYINVNDGYNTTNKDEESKIEPILIESPHSKHSISNNSPSAPNTPDMILIESVINNSLNYTYDLTSDDFENTINDGNHFQPPENIQSNVNSDIDRKKSCDTHLVQKNSLIPKLSGDYKRISTRLSSSNTSPSSRRVSMIPKSSRRLTTSSQNTSIITEKAPSSSSQINLSNQQCFNVVHKLRELPQMKEVDCDLSIIGETLSADVPTSNIINAVKVTHSLLSEQISSGNASKNVEEILSNSPIKSSPQSTSLRRSNSSPNRPKSVSNSPRQKSSLGNSNTASKGGSKRLKVKGGKEGKLSKGTGIPQATTITTVSESLEGDFPENINPGHTFCNVMPLESSFVDMDYFYNPYFGVVK